jgi:hypothetical protein
MLNRRLQVLVDDARFQRLAEVSKRTGAPVGELVRRAIDNEFPPVSVSAERERAGEELLAMPAPPGPEPDWEDQKREILDAPLRKWSAG